jgi:prepilin-type processing-associated H-X9-DG protein
MKQWGTQFMMYTNDSKGWLMDAGKKVSAQSIDPWTKTLFDNGYIGGSYGKKNNGSEKRGIMQCPNDRREKNISYYLNLGITQSPNYNGTNTAGDTNGTCFYYKAIQINHANKAMYLIDGWTGITNNYSTGSYWTSRKKYRDSEGAEPDFRHNKSANALFVDGHMEAVKNTDPRAMKTLQGDQNIRTNDYFWNAKGNAI